MRTLLKTMLALSLFALIAAAPEAAVPQPPAAAHGPALTGEDGKPVPGVRLARVDLKGIVHGNLAQATMTLTFANDQPRVLGGTLGFPLPEGATVTGYGLEINGQIVDGVAVERERARIIYESELHKRVDPGLVEHVAGNAFRTRLYPIPANGTRSIRIEYVTQIEQGKDGAALSLPMGFAGVDELAVRLDMPEATVAPTVKAGGIEGLAFAKAKRGFSASATVKKAATADDLVIGLPGLADRSVAVEKRPKFARTIEELEQRDHAAVAPKGFDAFEHYFAATDTPAIGARPAVALKNKRVGVIWDSSLSRSSSDTAHELNLLGHILGRLGNPDTDLIIFSNDIQVLPMLGDGNVSTAILLRTIKSVPFDGATNLGALKFPKNVTAFPGIQVKDAPADYDLFLLFTDGFGNLGSDMPAKAEVPVYAICGDPQANHALLRSLCQESGGQYFNLKRATDDQVLAGVGDAPFSLVSIDCKPDEIADVYPPVGTAIGGRFTVSGRLLKPLATLTLHYGYGKQITASQSFTIDAGDAGEGSLLPRFWAQQKVAALSLFPDKNADELARLGKRFNLVTPNTSLLVLESADQYVQYRVVPPPSRPEIYKEFLAKIEQTHAQEAQSREQKLAQVAALWNARVQWWEAEYKYPKDLRVEVAAGKPARVEMGQIPASQPSELPRRHGQGASPVVNSPEPRDPAGAPVSGTTVPPEARDQFAGRPTPPAAPAAPNGRGANPERSVQANPAEGRPTLGPSPAADSRGRSADGQNEQRTGEESTSAAPGEHAANDIPGSISARSPVFGRSRNAARRFKPRDESGASIDSLEVDIKPWDPKTPYLAAMKAVAPEKAYGVYLEQRKTFARSPAFYLDSADYFLKIDQQATAVRVLTDIVELELQDARLLRVAAHRLNQIGQRDLAIDLFEKVLHQRPEEPQSYRDLALALADRADYYVGPDGAAWRAWHADADAMAISDYTRALELLNKVVLGNWPRFPEVELPVLMEANDIAAKVQRLPGLHDFHNPLDARLQKNLDLDVRVVMTWDADQTDIDLWVTEPSGEKCFYGHNRTVIGGLLSHDFTDGYGPEEYCLRRLMPGKYAIQADFFGSRQQELTGAATVQATVITDFGRPTEKRQALTLRLKDVKQVVDIGSITLGAGAPPKAEAAAQELKK